MRATVASARATGVGDTRRQRQLTPSVMDEWYLKGREWAHGVRLGDR